MRGGLSDITSDAPVGGRARLKLEVGRRYRTNNGSVVVILETNAVDRKALGTVPAGWRVLCLGRCVRYADGTPGESHIPLAWVSGVSARSAARQIQCSSRVATKYYAMFEGRAPAARVRGPRVSRETGQVAHPMRVCLRAGCDLEVVRDERLCPEHREIRRPVGGSDFIRALTPAELMRGRA